jgi:hypothetical protein
VATEAQEFRQVLQAQPQTMAVAAAALLGHLVAPTEMVVLVAVVQDRSLRLEPRARVTAVAVAVVDHQPVAAQVVAVLLSSEQLLPVQQRVLVLLVEL